MGNTDRQDIIFSKDLNFRKDSAFHKKKLLPEQSGCDCLNLRIKKNILVASASIYPNNSNSALLPN
ncbi:hypothetical protein ACT29I_04690 [Saccharicrinis sp. GN24d3]